jgi:uncharacterized protein (TIGR01777 family)
MNILIAGASGFIGQELVTALKQHHSITVLGRDKATLQRKFLKPITLVTWDSLSQLDANSYDVVINLCGSNVAASRWSPAVKSELIESRVRSISRLTDWIIKQGAKPRFMCANAVGIYGLQENGDRTEFDEESPVHTNHPQDFLSEIGLKWQQALQPAIDYGLNVVTMRFGVVLKKGQSMLKKLGLSFYMGLGSIVGDGKQAISWVHIDDIIGAILFLLMKPEASGAFNITAPNPASQAEFSHALAKAMHRPLLLKTPAFVIRALFGEMGDCLLLKGQRVIPKRLKESGYVFIYPRIEDALTHEFE